MEKKPPPFEKDLVLEGVGVIVPKLKALGKGAGKPEDLLVDGYEGGPDLCTLLGVWCEGVGVLNGKGMGKSSGAIRTCLRSMVETGSQSVERMEKFEKMILSGERGPGWVGPLLSSGEWSETVLKLWVSRPESPAWYYTLLALKKKAEKKIAGERPHPTLAVAFPSTLKTTLMTITSSTTTPDLTISEISWVISVVSTAYHSALYTVLLLSEWASRSHKAANLLHEVQDYIVKTRPEDNKAVLPYASVVLAQILREEELCGGDAVKLRRNAEDLTAFSHPILLKKMVSAGLGGEQWVDLLIDITETNREEVFKVVNGYRRAHKVITEHSLLTDALRSVSADVVEGGTESGVGGALCIEGFCSILKTVLEGVVDDEAVETVKLLIGVILGCVEGRRNMAHPASTLLLEICMRSTSAANSHSVENATCLVISAYVISIALASSPIPPLARLAKAPTPSLNRAVLHFLLAMLHCYLPLPHSIEMRSVLTEVASTQAAEEAMRTALPTLTPYLPKGVVFEKVEFERFMKKYGRVKK